MKYLKRMLCTIIFLLMIVSVNQSVIANEEVTVILDGEKLTFDVQPQIINGRTMVPFRTIFEALGAEVKYIESWNEVQSYTFWN